MLIERANTEYCVYRIPGLIRTEAKTLLCCYECRKNSASDWAQIDLKVIRSTDDGQTWETVLRIPGSGDTLNNPVLIADGDRVHFLYCRNYMKLYHCVSADDGKTFSGVRDVSCAFEEVGRPYTVAAVGPGHGIVHNGNLLIPAWFAWNEENPAAHRPSFIASVYSKDHGQTWHCGAVIGENVLVNPSECAFAVTADGKVLNSIRNENPEKKRAVAVSPDGFSQWTSPRFAQTLTDPICQGSMDHREGKIFHINCDDPERRSNLTVKVTEDGFATVTGILVDEMGGYSDLAVTEDAVFVVYERNLREEGLNFLKLQR